MSDTARPPKKKIAILGGGIAALTTAFALTDEPGWDERMEISVYQMGWRLGGKCATGRNHAHGDRIEEHGLHVWPGFYQNAFRVLRKCYGELNRPAGTPLATWDKAFHKQNKVALMEEVDGRWVPWPIDFPSDQEVPGEGDEFVTPLGFLRRLLRWMAELVESEAEAVAVGWWRRLLDGARAVGHALGRDLHLALDLAHRLDPEQLHQPEHHKTILEHLERFCDVHFRANPEGVRADDALRQLWICVELGQAVVRGIFADDVLRRGFDALDQYDLTEWLRRHGAQEEVWWSAPVRAIYDLVFAYDGGDTNRPNLAAGVALRGCLRMFFAYKGAIFWEMNAGMGEVVFTPFYEVLRRRGVTFHFFHRVNNLGLSPDKKSIDTITLDVQATVKKEVLRDHGGYQPLVDVKGLQCWPSTPRYEQLEEGADLERRQLDLESAWTPWPDEARRTLTRGEHFDDVVLGISLGALPHICRELIEADPRWAEMVKRLPTVATQALQLWFNRDAGELGGPMAGGMVGSYVEPLDTWADMTHLIERESRPAGQVRAIAYACGPLADDPHGADPSTDPRYAEGQKRRVKEQALEFLRKQVAPLWPGAADPANPGQLMWDLLVDPGEAAGEQRLEAQFWRANVDPSERYVLSVKGSTSYRLPADGSGFANLYLAGDWVATRLGAGCVEAATMAGLAAARKVGNLGVKIVGEHDFSPDGGAEEGP